ncbi:hypothetical protein NEILACOT_05464 [Neisseria lactamica ATCC 23970]|uniref:Uncharacterized protein n=1 Tax=Neisseria lactamica ATCC 23970 TaxID=546265 RepID=D0WD28_NEILA|nr:hypothetical protein NEILACOT_05464 [Neisseria lactamica ATCC 23970]
MKHCAAALSPKMSGRMSGICGQGGGFCGGRDSSGFVGIRQAEWRTVRANCASVPPFPDIAGAVKINSNLKH